MVIRVYQSDDEVEVIALWERAGLTRPWNDPRKDIARKLAVQPDLFFVLVVEAKIAGTLMAGYEGHRGWMNYLAVDPGSQRQGHGGRLVEHAERALRERGCPKINLQLRVTNESAAAFYRRLGYLDDEVVSLGKRLELDDPTG